MGEVLMWCGPCGALTEHEANGGKWRCVRCGELRA